MGKRGMHYIIFPIQKCPLPDFQNHCSSYQEYLITPQVNAKLTFQSTESFKEA